MFKQISNTEKYPMNLLFSVFYYFYYRKPFTLVEMSKKGDILFTNYLSLIKTLLHDNKTFEIKNNLDFVCDKFLTDREKEFVIMYFFKKYTYKQISDNTGITISCVGQIIRKAVFKLSDTIIMDIIIYGYEQTMDILHKKPIVKYSLDEFNFCFLHSPGIITILKRNGIFTVNELLKLDKTELFNIDGFGKKTFDTLNTILSKFNLSIE